ncbi:MAG: hypothetical protein PHH75_04895 [Candidatus Omnitrophica bacterium]|nr:hypothetical protein [Candidatus Omnitrophota bacterium]MDD5574499.1 hypothetical protein [Candidatus Omnitrophota bacterium]
MKTMTALCPQDRDSLYKRYLFWLYKTTRDECDRIERKFTQIAIDKEITRFLDKALAGSEAGSLQGVDVFIGEWRRYAAQKAADAPRMKWTDAGALKPEYAFLRLKLRAIEQAIAKYLGKKAIKDFRRLCEEAAMQGILQDHSGRR